MSDKQTYWLADPEGAKARVFGDEARDEWTKVHGWTESTEPVGLEFQHIRNEQHGGRGVLNHEAVLLHEGLGWFPSGPPGYDDPAPAAAKNSSAPKAAAVGDKKE